MRTVILTFTWALMLAVAPFRVSSGAEVVTSIAPVHSLVARVMQGAGTPYLLLPPGTSPHDHALRPSDAAALEQSELVFWIGPGLETWLEHPLATLASGARVIRLAESPGLTRLARREGAAFEADDDHSEGGHTDDEADPHLWLDPSNAKLWLNTIASALAETDPRNQALYQTNAETAGDELDALVIQIDARLAPVRGRPFVVFHDAFHYFERRFRIEAVGAVALSDARIPGPARIVQIRERIRALKAICLFREPQFRAALVATVAEGTGIRIGQLDPLGINLEPGPDLYSDLLRGIADSIAGCLG